QVDRRVGGVHATADHGRVVHLERVTRAGHGDVGALDRLVRADDVLRGDLAGHDVVGEDRGQRRRARIGLQAVDGRGVDLLEGVVDGCEDGELPAVQRVDEVDL